MTNCGSGSEDCCASTAMPGGTYYRTYAADGNGPSGEADPASVSCFRLDKYEVTVGRFRQFVGAVNGGWLPQPASGKHLHVNGGMGLSSTGGGYETGWLASDDKDVASSIASPTCGASSTGFATWTASPGNHENQPINCVSWKEAYAFCIWDGGFLPSEAEWEYAAAGGSQQRAYPWGSTDPGTANRYAIYSGGIDCLYPDGATCASATNVAPVGTAMLGAGLWGQLDLAGNVSEWVLDGYGPYVDPCVDCVGGGSGFVEINGQSAPLAVQRGGSFRSLASSLLPSYRVENSNGDADFGLRCARAP